MSPFSKDYPIVITPLSEEDGGGYLGFAPDLQGCYSDGETQEEALRNTADAIEEWIDAYRSDDPKRELPKPGWAGRRMHAEQEKMAAVIRDLTNANELIDDKLEYLATRIEEIQEQIDSMEEWSRFVVLVGDVKPPATIEAHAHRSVGFRKL